MRLLLLSLFGLAASFYSVAAFDAYREERLARAPVPPGAGTNEPLPRHPEASLKRLREAFATEEYTDALIPYLERALMEAPSSYQASFLLAAFYANRLEKPDVVRQGFECALERFPANGRLHLTYAEWLLAPRASAPYRAYRGPANDEDSRRRALEQIAAATALEPDLTGRALQLLVRFRVPQEDWRALLPPGEATMGFILSALERSSLDRQTRRGVLEDFLRETGEASTLRELMKFAKRWGETELSRAAAERFYALAREHRSTDLVEATLGLAARRLDDNDGDGAYEVSRNTLDELERDGRTEKSVTLLVGMADLYLRRGRLTMAQSLYTEAATISPYDTRAHLGLARVYRRSGNHAEALRELEQVLELDSENAEARAELDAIRSEMSFEKRH